MRIKKNIFKIKISRDTKKETSSNKRDKTQFEQESN
jgi:hypothetical protein